MAGNFHVYRVGTIVPIASRATRKEAIELADSLKAQGFDNYSVSETTTIYTTQTLEEAIKNG